jgi:hypothetical protein
MRIRHKGARLHWQLQAVAAAMARAREADRAGDQIACEQALADVQRARGRSLLLRTDLSHH